jgi:exodeoxyribonuclease-3
MELSSMKIATWNINSIRRRLPLLLDWLEANRPDVMCLQETKVQDSDFPVEPLRAAGYHVTFRGKKSYNGVATLSLSEPEAVLHGLREGPDAEDDRVLQTVIRGIPILNTYVPQGFKINTEKYDYKLHWLALIRDYFGQHFDPNRPAIWLGDMNVAPEPIDVYHPDRRVNDVRLLSRGASTIHFEPCIPSAFSTRTGITSATRSRTTGDGESITST